MKPAEVRRRSVRTDRFQFSEGALHDTWLVERSRQHDERGEFSRLFCTDEFAAVGLDQPPRQANYSQTTRRGTVRGMHFQYPPYGETKVVTCLTGRIFDILLDLRLGSPTFRHWSSFELSAATMCSVVIPPGVAHGFQTLEDDCRMIYFHSEMFATDAQGGVSVLDMSLKPGPIAFPLPITMMSDRDRALAPIPDNFLGLPV